MSRSYRKYPFGCAVGSLKSRMKPWKVAYNRKHRYNQKSHLRKHFLNSSWDDYIPRHILDDSNVYDSPRDGTGSYQSKPHEEDCYNPKTGEYDKWWNSLESWKKTFRK